MKLQNVRFAEIRTDFVSGCGLSDEAPEGFAHITLMVPLSLIEGKSPIDLQSDLGLPWSDHDGNGLWFDEIIKQ